MVPKQNAQNLYHKQMNNGVCTSDKLRVYHVYCTSERGVSLWESVGGRMGARPFLVRSVRSPASSLLDHCTAVLCITSSLSLLQSTSFIRFTVRSTKSFLQWASPSWRVYSYWCLDEGSFQAEITVYKTQ